MADAESPGDEPTEGKGGEPRRPDWLERTVSLLSALLVLAIVGYLVREATLPQRAAEFIVRAKGVRAAAASFAVPIAVRNVGDAAAKDVMIHVSLEVEGKTAGASDLTIDWLPGRSEHEAIAVFGVDPRTGSVRAEVTGYNTP